MGWQEEARPEAERLTSARSGQIQQKFEKLTSSFLYCNFATTATYFIQVSSSYEVAAANREHLNTDLRQW